MRCLPGVFQTPPIVHVHNSNTRSSNYHGSLRTLGKAANPDLSECQGSPGTPNEATLKNVSYVEYRTWTECFGTVVEVTSYLTLQKYSANGPDGPFWGDIAGPTAKHFPGVTGTKLYQEGAVTCRSAGGHAKYRSAASATWEDPDGGIGHTNTGYSAGATVC